MYTLCFLLHVYRKGLELYTDHFTSRKSLANHLRGLGLHFSNSDLCKLGESSLKLYGKDGFIYEIEEITPPSQNILNVDGKLFLALRDYCRLTGEHKKTVYKRFCRRQIPGLAVGRRNLVFIYWRDADE